MDASNPYQSPVAPIGAAPDMDATALPLASARRRFANWFLDHLFYTLFTFAIGIVIGLAGGADEITTLVDFLISFAAFLLYYISQELLFGQTLGKRITNTKVVRADGAPLSGGQIIGRTFAREIPFEALSFFGNNGFPIGWHDKLSGTRVVHMG